MHLYIRIAKLIKPKNYVMRKNNHIVLSVLWKFLNDCFNIADIFLDIEFSDERLFLIIYCDPNPTKFSEHNILYDE